MGQVPAGNESVPSLRKRKKNATYEAIVVAAWDLFGEQGYDKTSINDIADRANVAPRTFFRYFPTKDAVIYPEFDLMLERVRLGFAARPTDEPVLVSLLVALDSLSTSMTEDSSRNQRRHAVLKSANSESLTGHFHRRLAEDVGEMVRDREAQRPDVEIKARLAAGFIRLVMDASRALWLETGATESLPDVGHRCIATIQELLTQASRTATA